MRTIVDKMLVTGQLDGEYTIAPEDGERFTVEVKAGDGATFYVYSPHNARFPVSMKIVTSPEDPFPGVIATPLFQGRIRVVVVPETPTATITLKGEDRG